MLALPLYILLIIYLAFLAMFVIFTLINIGHLFQTASLTFTSLFFTIVVISATLIIVWLTWYFLQGVNWHASLTIFDSSWIKNIFSFSNPTNFSE
jgi:hypothetical protein